MDICSQVNRIEPYMGARYDYLSVHSSRRLPRRMVRLAIDGRTLNRTRSQGPDIPAMGAYSP